jgi:hypothetical protein
MQSQMQSQYAGSVYGSAVPTSYYSPSVPYGPSHAGVRFPANSNGSLAHSASSSLCCVYLEFAKMWVVYTAGNGGHQQLSTCS